MADLIDRQAAIDAIDEYMVGKNCATDGTMMASLINELVIKRLPSAADVPDTNVGKMVDTISRQAAIDVAVQSIRDWDGMFIQEANCRIRDAINELPPAQPEKRTETHDVCLDAISRQEAIEALDEQIADTLQADKEGSEE